ncbi:MAG: hypothetical protein R3F61_11430 [Myxococcota bacterium]
MTRAHPLFLALVLGCSGGKPGPPLDPGGYVLNVSDTDVPAMVGVVPFVDCAIVDYPGLVGFIPADTEATLPPGLSQPWEPDAGARCYAGTVYAPADVPEAVFGQIVIDLELPVTDPTQGTPTDNVLIVDPEVPSVSSLQARTSPGACPSSPQPSWYGGTHTGQIIDISVAGPCTDLTIVDAESQDWVIGLCDGPDLPYAVGEVVAVTQSGPTFSIQTDAGARPVLIGLDITVLPSWVTASSPHAFDQRTEGLRDPACTLRLSPNGRCNLGLAIDPVLEIGGASTPVPWGTSIIADSPDGPVELRVYDATTPLFPECGVSLTFAITPAG